MAFERLHGLLPLFQGLIPNQTWLRSLKLESLVKPAGFTPTEAKLLVTSML